MGQTEEIGHSTVFLSKTCWALHNGVAGNVVEEELGKDQNG